MQRAPRITAIVCTFVLAGATAASAQDEKVEPAPKPAAAAPGLVLAGDYHGVDLALDADGHRHIVASGTASTDDVRAANDAPTSDLWYVTDRAGSWTTQRLLPEMGQASAGMARRSLSIATAASTSQ